MNRRVKQILDSIRAADLAYADSYGTFIRHLRLPPCPPDVLGRLACISLSQAIPWRSAEHDPDRGASQTIRAPLAALHAGGNCDDYAYLLGVIFGTLIPETRHRRLLHFVPNIQHPYHVRFAFRPQPLSLELSFFDPTPGFAPFGTLPATELNNCYPWPQ